MPILWLLDLAVALAELGRGDELLEATALVRKQTPWLEAARAVAAGEPRHAALIYKSIGAKPDEALARLRAAELLRAAGRSDEAELEFRQVLAFYRSAGASTSSRPREGVLTESTV